MTAPAAPDSSEALIRFEGLHKAFGPKVIFDDLSLEVRKGETLTVIGGSGTGKSVLLKCLIGLMYPDGGRIVFDGQDVSGYGEKEFLPIRRRVAMVFQGSALFDSSPWARTSPTRCTSISPRCQPRSGRRGWPGCSTW